MEVQNRTMNSLQQGSDEWHALRGQFFTASEAPAALGASKYVKRSDLVRQKATGIQPQHDAPTLVRFAAGHQAEAAARPIAESIIGDDLSAVTMTATVDGMPLLASLDGLTFDGETAWETKLWNESLAQSVLNNELPEHYTAQMDQQLLVSGAKRVLFTCSDGTPEKTVSMWYVPTPASIEKLLAGWRQFQKDVAAYQPEEQAEKPVAKVHQSLPALLIDARGEVTASNLGEFQAIALSRIQAINTVLETDQDFADADSDAKWLRDISARMKDAVQRVRAGMSSVDEVMRTLEHLDDVAAKKAIDLEKKVKIEKDARKEKIILLAENELMAHITSLNTELGTSYLTLPRGIFAPVVKGLKSLQSMEDKVRGALAGAMAEASNTANLMLLNRDHLRADGQDWITLFPDFAIVGKKEHEDFRALAALRIGEHQKVEAARLESERQRIRAEEEAKAKREADAALRQQLAESEAKVQACIAEAKEAGVMDATLLDNLAAVSKDMASDVIADIDARRVIGEAKASAAQDSSDTLTMGQLNALLFPIKVDSTGLAEIGFTPCATLKMAKLYRAADVPRICDALIQRILKVKEIQ